MPQTKSITKSGSDFLLLFWVALLAMLVLRTGPQIIWNQVHAVGFGIAVALGGVALSFDLGMADGACATLPLCLGPVVCCARFRGPWATRAGGKVLGESMRISLEIPYR
jgi:hypothetical protein